MRSERFHTAGPTRLVVQNAAGHIELETVDGEETSVELTPLDARAREEVETAVLEQRGDTIAVEIGRVRGLLRGLREARVRVAVRCPHGTEVTVKAVSADTEARGSYGDVQLNGVSGEVRVGEVAGDARIKTVSGDVRVGPVAGEAQVQTVSGDLSVESVGGRAELRSVSGDVRLGAGAGPVTVQTVSGDQRVGSVVQGAVELKSVSGDVVVGVAPGSRVWVDAKTVSGSTKSELDLSDDGGSGDDGPLVEVRANALSGDIELTRAR